MEFKGTKGEWIANLEYMPDHTIVEVTSGDSNTEDWAMFTLYNAKDRKTQEANAKLIADAGTTINQCDLLPSELLSQRNEMLEMLGKITLVFDMFTFPTEQNLKDYSQEIKQLIKKATL